MMVQVCNCGVKAVVAESLDGQLACLRCRGRAQASAEARATQQVVRPVKTLADLMPCVMTLAKTGPAPSAEYAAECRGCEACPDGICSRHHPDDREAALGAHPEPKAAPVDPYAQARIRRLMDAAGRLPGPSTTLPTATALAKHHLEGLRSAVADARAGLAEDEARIARLEAALAECGDPGAIAEHGRKAGGA